MNEPLCCSCLAKHFLRSPRSILLRDIHRKKLAAEGFEFPIVSSYLLLHMRYFFLPDLFSPETRFMFIQFVEVTFFYQLDYPQTKKTILPDWNFKTLMFIVFPL